MSTRPGIVAEAAVDVLAARLSTELRLERDEIYRIARAQAAELTRAGFHVTVPAAALATTQRRLKASRTTS
ncbi:hypothetical protein KVH24_23285 [Streptomyces olivaceus]|uniref:hypothetical protein n=1 Tax=Streptomyces olivaceus TaxID=47716 RepID=UPI001CCE4A23|nr:hypothetical protein [Streptomyces olivaceus]MBZ6175562.1 hypothetical protein [Streptomyces olivaceus]MBZ6181896.1 hypothetical protein [Streptomyces olivaceus]